jgi:hypothetical protein
MYVTSIQIIVLTEPNNKNGFISYEIHKSTYYMVDESTYLMSFLTQRRHFHTCRHECQLSSVSFSEDLHVQPAISEQLHLIGPHAVMSFCV